LKESGDWEGERDGFGPLAISVKKKKKLRKDQTTKGRRKRK